MDITVGHVGRRVGSPGRLKRDVPAADPAHHFPCRSEIRRGLEEQPKRTHGILRTARAFRREGPIPMDAPLIEAVLPGRGERVERFGEIAGVQESEARPELEEWIFGERVAERLHARAVHHAGQPADAVLGFDDGFERRGGQAFDERRRAVFEGFDKHPGTGMDCQRGDTIRQRERQFRNGVPRRHPPLTGLLGTRQEPFELRVEPAGRAFGSPMAAGKGRGVRAEACPFRRAPMKFFYGPSVFLRRVHKDPRLAMLDEFSDAAMGKGDDGQSGIHHFLEIQFGRRVGVGTERIAVDIECLDHAADVLYRTPEVEIGAAARLLGVGLEPARIAIAADDELHARHLDRAAHCHEPGVHLDRIHRADVADSKPFMRARLRALEAVEIGARQHHGRAFAPHIIRKLRKDGMRMGMRTAGDGEIREVDQRPRQDLGRMIAPDMQP